VFRGEDAYVSANFYPSKAENHKSVPTWNYQAVHVHGTISFQHDDHSKRAAVGLLTRIHERRVNGQNGWRMADAPADYMQMMLGNIVAFRIAVTRVLAKSKLSQNRTDQDHAGVVDGLVRTGHANLGEIMKYP
jgi:transcriptional regulator